MAVGDPIYFEGNILDFKERPSGFFSEAEVDITTPNDLLYPILQTRVLTQDGYRTVAPLGSWRDVLSSTEIYNAMDNFGYRFKVHRGFIFAETDIIYDRYVEYFNNIKTNTPKNDSMYLISKLLMNGLFGKTGQDYKFNDTLILNENSLVNYIQDKRFEVSSITQLTDDLKLASIIDNKKYSHTIPESYQGCVAHASEIAAGARVEMSLIIKFLKDNGYKIYYMDTDSVFTDKPLPDHLVSKTELGKLKLENIYKEAVFLAPKVYAGITQSGEEVIKIKGLSYDTIERDVSLELLKSLLYKNKSLTFNHIKSFRKIDKSTISLLNQTYNLIPTENKRKLNYDNNNLLISTKPFFINHDKKLQ